MTVRGAPWAPRTFLCPLAEGYAITLFLRAMFRRKPARAVDSGADIDANADANADDGDQPSRHRAQIGRKVAAKLSRNPMVARMESECLTLYMRDDFVSPAECAQLRAVIDAGARPSSLFSGTAEADYRTSDSCSMYPSEPPLDAIVARICALMGLERAWGETIQGQRYRVGQEYKFHWDFFPVNTSYWPHMRAQGGQRCWTAMIYLNSVEAGGETCFPHAGLSVAPLEGRLLMWNNLREDGAPNQESLHSALPVAAGAKYVLTQWFRERPWKARPA